MAAIVDTGPLVAYFIRSERHHHWATDRIEELEAPLLVCEPVLAEAAYLLRRHLRARDVLLELVEDGALRVAFQIEEHASALRRLLRKYSDIPISLADACIVLMAEIHGSHSVLTLDADFLIYRTSSGAPLSLIYPGND
jgi:predicted nucleic acid-binding protein